MKKKKVKIYLGDFIHNYFGVGTYMFPLNIGYVAAWANKLFASEIDIQLFKYPGDFISRVKESPPDIVGLSNYTWNADLNNKTARWIKSVSPQTGIVFGGPNISYSKEGYERFFRTHPATDFYIPYQGEAPFGNLLTRVFEKGLGLDGLKSQPIDGVVFYDTGNNRVIEG